MNQLLTAKTLTMSSRDIAELVDKRHDHVMTDVRKLMEFYMNTYSPEKSGELIKPSTYVDSTGRTLPCFDLSKDACLDLITGYSLAHRHKVNQRWMELESAQPKVQAMSQVEIVAFLAQQAVVHEKQMLALESRMDALETKQKALDREEDHYTIKGFCSLHDIDLSNAKMSALSKKVKRASEAKNYAWHEVTDPRWGKVKCYHLEILTEVFEKEGLLERDI